MAWVRRSRPILADPPAESPSTIKISLRAGSLSEQSASFPGIPTNQGFAASYHATLDEEPDRCFVIRATPSAGSGPASFQLLLCRTVQVNLAPGESTTMSISPFESHNSVHIQNINDERAEVRIQHSHPVVDTIPFLSPGQEFVIPPFVAPGGADEAVMKIINVSPIFPAILEISEIDIAYDVDLVPGRPAFEARLKADVLEGEDYVLVKFNGEDIGGGGLIDLIIANTLVQDPGCDGTLDVDDIPAFVQALVDPAGYANAFPYCYIGSADINEDGFIDGRDVGALVAQLLTP